jgi:glycerol-3-phosphate cytidylyltransferase
MIVLTESRLKRIVEEERSQGHRIVTTNGTFDIPHIAHKRYLEQARSFGDVLIALVNSDASVRGNKGEERPFNPEEERAEMVDAYKSINYAFVFDEPTPEGLLELIQPDYHVKGGDFIKEKVAKEREIVESHGGRCIYLPKIEGRSTTLMVEKIRSRGNGNNGYEGK